jgi:hypothetical protein
MQRWIVRLLLLTCIAFSPLGYCRTNRTPGVDDSVKGFDYAKGFQDGLQEHRAMLEEARQELHGLERQDTIITNVFYFLTLLFTVVSACNAWSYISSKRAVEEARDEAQQILELVSNAHKLFESQLPHEKRRLLRFVLSNCTWKGGELQSTFKQPFDLLAHRWAAMKTPVGSLGAKTGLNEEWLLR